jgi:hypothetical protein
MAAKLTGRDGLPGVTGAGATRPARQRGGAGAAPRPAGRSHENLCQSYIGWRFVLSAGLRLPAEPAGRDACSHLRSLVSDDSLRRGAPVSSVARC